MLLPFSLFIYPVVSIATTNIQFIQVATFMGKRERKLLGHSPAIDRETAGFHHVLLCRLYSPYGARDALTKPPLSGATTSVSIASPLPYQLHSLLYVCVCMDVCTCMYASSPGFPAFLARGRRMKLGGLGTRLYMHACIYVCMYVHNIMCVIYLSPYSTPLLWFSLCVVMIIIRVTTVICMASMTLFMNNSVTFDKLGAFNGFAASLTAVFRYCTCG